MITHYCSTCDFYYREAELGKAKRCPECGATTKPRLMLGGQIMGDA